MSTRRMDASLAGFVNANTCQFPTPAEGDWILFMKTDKKQTGEAGKPKEEKPAQK